MPKQNKNKNKKQNLHDNMVWTPLRKEVGQARHLRGVGAPSVPVVVNKAKKQTVESISIACGAFTFHYDSWSDLRDDYRNLVLRVATIADAMSA